MCILSLFLLPSSYFTTVPVMLLPQTFTRLAELVLAANKKDLDLLRTSINDELNLTTLEEEEGLCDAAAADQNKGCWC